MNLNILRAFNGDAIHIRFQNKEFACNILIDGGMPNTYLNLKGKKGKKEFGALKELFDELKGRGEKIDLLILTHIDDDHIGGILRWFSEDSGALEFIKEVWFNSGRLIHEHFTAQSNIENDLDVDNSNGLQTSVPQGVRFEELIESKPGLWRRELIKTGTEARTLGPAKFWILSPDDDKLRLLLKKWKKEDIASIETSGIENDYQLSIKEHLATDKPLKEDQAVHNGSSISFLFELGKFKCLFLADAHASTIVDSLQKMGFNKENKLVVDLVKLSHHGSVYNNTEQLLQILDCRSFVVSSNGDKHAHPHKRLLARLIDAREDCRIYFNYPEVITDIFSTQDIIDFPRAEFLSTDRLNTVFE